MRRGEIRGRWRRAAALGALLGCGLVREVRADDRQALETETERLRALAFVSLQKESQRLLRVSDRIRLAGTSLCDRKLTPVFGFLAAGLGELPSALRAPAEQSAGSDVGVVVLAVRPGSPAERAGIVAGEAIVAVDDRPVRRAVDLAWQGFPPTAQTTILKVSSRGGIREVPVRVEVGCALVPSIVYHDSLNAGASDNQGEIVVTTGLLRFANTDDELGIIVGHELAHVVLERGGFRDTEAEADYLGAYLAARANYDVSLAAAILRRLGLETLVVLPDRGLFSHPMPTQRFIALQETAREIDAKRTRGEPLEPRAQE